MDYPAKLIGTSKVCKIPVLIHPGMLAIGDTVATQMLTLVDIYYPRMKAFFPKNWPDIKVQLVIVPLSKTHTGQGGYHYPGQPYIYSDVLLAADKKSYDNMFNRFVFCCELLEMFTEASTSLKFWNSSCDSCEGLSRAMANSLVPGQLVNPNWHYETVPGWINSNRQDFSGVVTYYNTVSIGFNACALYYMHFVLKRTWNDIIAAGADSMEQVYKNLTGKSGLYNALMSVVNKKYPPGTTIVSVSENENIFD